MGPLHSPKEYLFNLQATNSGEAKRMWRQHIKEQWEHQCAYCGSEENLTIDHVVPVSRFLDKSSANTWENKVCCCKKCNSKKGNRTPEEANMKMLSKPHKMEILFLVENVPEEWRSYI